MIRHVVFKHRSFCSKQASYVLSLHRKRILSLVCYHTDSINGPVFDEMIIPEAKLTPEQSTKILRENEAKFKLEENGPVKYYEMNYLGANNPTEDRQAQGRIRTCDSYIHLFGVFDGHGGPWCSDTVSQRLFEYIGSTLNPPNALEPILKKANATSTRHVGVVTENLGKCSSFLESYFNPLKDLRNSKTKDIHQCSLLKHIEEVYTAFDSDNTDIAGALESAFLTLDRDLCAEAIPPDTQRINEDLLQLGAAGSCACVALVKGTDLYIANCGDTRAILGTMDEHGNMSTIALSNDHNIRNQSEIVRVLSEHPISESHSVIREDRLLGLLMPFRAFGDVRFKWPKTYLERYLEPWKKIDAIPQFYLTPPYLTARPEIKRHKLTRNDKFLVLASDGISELLSPEQVVKIVFDHMQYRKQFDELISSKSDHDTSSLISKEGNKVLHTQLTVNADQSIDRNSATYLMRQALTYTSHGQGDNKQLSCLLTFQNPRSVRDDITITIVYFNEDYFK